MKAKALWMTVACLSALMLCASPAEAQEQEKKKRKWDSETQSKRKLRECNREELHEHLPIELVGIEQGDGQFRAASPALLKCSRPETKIDLEEYYDRKIAMYEQGKTFYQPLAATMIPGSSSGGKTGGPKGKPGAQVPASTFDIWVWVMPGGFILILVLLIMYQRGWWIGKNPNKT
jgi:hypothetical protein